LEGGLKRIEQLNLSGNEISGDEAFLLYDTYGFPIDLTRLIANERGWTLDEKGFEIALTRQKERSRKDAKRSTGDWVILEDGDVNFVGYDQLEVPDARVLRYRKMKDKSGEKIQLVLNKTPFYAEGGGQVGDKGLLYFGDETIQVLDTKKENNLILHFVDRIPENIEVIVRAEVSKEKRKLTENNHTSTHLLHAALRKVLGSHVTQKGSLVRDENFRFDFSHFSKMTKEEIHEVERIVNNKIRENIRLEEARNVPIEDAKASGAMMLFGEKYGENVRMITFDKNYSVELCGGCHVNSTGEIGFFKIVSESGIAAGVRRIEAITAIAAQNFVHGELEEFEKVKELFKGSVGTYDQVLGLQEENKMLKKKIDALMAASAINIKDELINSFETFGNVNFLAIKLPMANTKAAKTLAYNLEKEKGNAFILFGIENEGKAQLMLTISENLNSEGLHAGNIIKVLAKEIRGGGGGQAFFATAGGQDPKGIPNAIQKAKALLN
jgi:alanyl-tRNA synthetase